MEAKTAQLRVRPKAITAYGCGGTIFWETPTRARLLIDTGAVELVNAPRPGPAERPAPGPSETKPMEPAEKKSLAAGPDGPLTDSAPSSEPGPAALSSASAGDLVSPQRTSSMSKLLDIVAPKQKGRGRNRKSE